MLEYKAPSSVDCLSFSPSSSPVTYLALACSSLTGPTWNGQIVLLDEDLKEKARYSTLGGNDALAFVGREGDLLASGGDDGAINVWQVDTTGAGSSPVPISSKTAKSAPSPKSSPSAKASSPAKPSKPDPTPSFPTSATFASSSEGIVLSKPFISWGGHDDVVSALVTCPQDRSVCLSASWDMSVRRWNIVDDIARETFLGHCSPVHCIDHSHTSANVFCSGAQEGRVFLWDSRNTNAPSQRITLPSDAGTTSSSSSSSTSFSSSSSSASSSSSSSSSVGVFSSEAQRVAVRSVAFSPSAEFLLSLGMDNGVLHCVDIRNPTTTLQSQALHTRAIVRIHFNPHDSKILATSSLDGRISLFNTSENTTIKCWKHGTDMSKSVSFHPKKEGIVATGGKDKLVKLVDTRK